MATGVLKKTIFRALAVVLHSAFGFLVPFGVFYAIVVVEYLSGCLIAFDFQLELTEVPSRASYSSFACAWLFGLSKLTSIITGGSIGFIRSLLVISLSALLGIVVTTLIWGFFDGYRNTFGYNQIGDPNFWLATVLVGVFTFIVSRMMIRRTEEGGKKFSLDEKISGTNRDEKGV